jgi:hypothetical protein
MYLSVRGFCPKTSTSLQTTLAAEAHLAEGQFLLAEDTLNIIVIIIIIISSSSSSSSSSVNSSNDR